MSSAKVYFLDFARIRVNKEVKTHFLEVRPLFGPICCGQIFLFIFIFRMAAAAEKEKVPRFPKGSLRVLEEIIKYGDRGKYFSIARDRSNSTNIAKADAWNFITGQFNEVLFSLCPLVLFVFSVSDPCHFDPDP
jgi:hypothetical protein